MRLLYIYKELNKVESLTQFLSVKLFEENINNIIFHHSVFNSEILKVA